MYAFARRQIDRRAWRAATAPAFRLKLPMFGDTVIDHRPRSSPSSCSRASTDEVGNIQPNLSRVLGPGSVFALDGAEHRRRRKLLTPPFHGKSIKNYERIFEEETLREVGVVARRPGRSRPSSR